jgi:hypothetical protein
LSLSFLFFLFAVRLCNHHLFEKFPFCVQAIRGLCPICRTVLKQITVSSWLALAWVRFFFFLFFFFRFRFFFLASIVFANYFVFFLSSCFVQMESQCFEMVRLETGLGLLWDTRVLCGGPPWIPRPIGQPLVLQILLRKHPLPSFTLTLPALSLCLFLLITLQIDSFSPFLLVVNPQNFFCQQTMGCYHGRRSPQL